MSVTMDTPLSATISLMDMLEPATAARVLNWCAENGGGGVYRRAAGHVAGGKSGRPAHDDALALAVMDDLLATGRAATVEEAARTVARNLAGEHSALAARKRLAAKYRKRDNNQSII
jgi:hypothetical protein